MKSLSILLALAFPFVRETPFAAFVQLTEAEESAALDAAKTAWQSNIGSVSRPALRLPLGELPVEVRLEPLGRNIHAPVCDDLAPEVYRPRGWKPSLAADKPVSLGPIASDSTTRAFSRAELLDFKGKDKRQ